MVFQNLWNKIQRNEIFYKTQTKETYSVPSEEIPSLEEATTAPKIIFFSLVTFYIGPYNPRAAPMGKKKIQRSFLKNLWTKNEKSMKKLSHIF